MSTYPRYDDETNGRANTTAQLDPYDNHSARVGFPSPDVQSPHSTEYNPYGSPGDVRSTRDDGRSVFGDPSRATLVAEEDHDPFAKVPASTSPKNDDGTTRPVSRQYEDLEYAEPYFADRAVPPPQPQPNGLARFFPAAATGKYPIEQRIEAKRRGIGRQKYPFAVWTLTAAMIAVFVYELVLNSREQGTPVSFKPVVNPMLGPSQSALINLGARFPPCMKDVEGITPSTMLACLNDTANPPDRICSLEEVCGWGGFHGKEPDQSFRFVTPVFLHAGIIHILLNLLAQCTASAQIEREMGSTGFIIMYMAAGIFGNVLGGNFALVGAPSVGASGAIFGTIAVTWVDLLAHWSLIDRPVRRLVFQIIELLIGFALGYIPYVDNFAHIGGFVMGLLVGTVFYPVISQTKRHAMIMWAFRLAAIPLAILLYVVLVRNFYTSDPYAACSGCRYLSCFPLESNNHCKGTGFTTFSVSN